MCAQPLASILIPCGPNHLQLLDRAVESAKAQTVPVEVLTYIDRERRGPGYGRNVLAKQAQGLFVCMLDADDYLYPHAIARMLQAWKPGAYVYSDWDELDAQGVPHHVKATSCYVDWRYNEQHQRAYHLTPVLFPTRLYHAIGGHDEAMFGAEDTRFFFQANAHGIISLRVPEPLFVYSDDGAHERSSDAKHNSQWETLLSRLFSEFQGITTMACCGDTKQMDIQNVKHAEGDILVRAKWKGKRKVVGRVTGRKYGRHGNGVQLWIDPLDYQAECRYFETAEFDAAALSPSPDDIATALGKPGALEAHIRASGIRNWATMEKPGLDMQQDPAELAQFLQFCLDNGVQTVLEIGTGESGGLARYMAGAFGWDVTSIDVTVPEVYAPARYEQGEGMTFESGGFWRVIQADSQQPEQVGFEGETGFDLVFIDGDHSAEGVKNDHENYGQWGRIIAFHDISPEGYWGGVADYWKEIAYTKAGNLRKGYHEAINLPAKTGLGWYVPS